MISCCCSSQFIFSISVFTPFFSHLGFLSYSITQVNFNITVTSKGCPNEGKSETIKIKPLGFTEEVEIILNFICDCQCQNNDVVKKSEKCSLNGTFECGACR